MKNLKTKLMASVVMLLIAALLMSTASYAWFTISTNPEVSNITGNVTANGNLEIALDGGAQKTPAASAVGDAGQNETWGNLVDLKAFFDATTAYDTVVFKPVQIGTGSKILENNQLVLSKPVYGKDGRVKELTALNRINAADAEDWSTSTKPIDNTKRFGDLGGIWVYTDASSGTGTGTTAGTQTPATYDAHIYAVEVDYWLRTNVANSRVSLTAAFSRSEDEHSNDKIAGEDGLGSWITDNRVDADHKQNITILFADCGAQETANKAGEEVTMSSPTWYVAEYGAAADGKCTLTLKECTIDSTGKITPKTSGENLTSIALTENKAELVKMYILMDGAELTNADALEAIKNITMNIQFTSNETLVSEDVEMNDYGRNN